MVSKTIAIIQARTTSIRLPGKVMYKINGTPLIEILHKRLKKSKKLDNIVIATTQKSTKLINFLRKKKIEYFVGSETNVLNRYYKVGSSISEDSYTVGVDDGRAGDSVDFPGSDMSMNEDSYTAGVTDKGPAFDDHMTKDKSKRLK